MSASQLQRAFALLSTGYHCPNMQEWAIASDPGSLSQFKQPMHCFDATVPAWVRVAMARTQNVTWTVNSNDGEPFILRPLQGASHMRQAPVTATQHLPQQIGGSSTSDRAEADKTTSNDVSLEVVDSSLQYDSSVWRTVKARMWRFRKAAFLNELTEVCNKHSLGPWSGDGHRWSDTSRAQSPRGRFRVGESAAQLALPKGPAHAHWEQGTAVPMLTNGQWPSATYNGVRNPRSGLKSNQLLFRVWGDCRRCCLGASLPRRPPGDACLSQCPNEAQHGLHLWFPDMLRWQPYASSTVQRGPREGAQMLCCHQHNNHGNAAYSRSLDRC